MLQLYVPEGKDHDLGRRCFFVEEYRCVVSRGYYVFLRFLCVPFLCIVSY